MREPLRDQSGVEFTLFLPSALADHWITVFYLTGINIVDLFAAVRLADPLRRAIVLHSLLFAGTRLANGQGGFIRTAPDDNPLRSCFAICLFFPSSPGQEPPGQAVPIPGKQVQIRTTE